MEVDVSLKKVVRPVDLALSAARKRQSARTRFVHGTAAAPQALDLVSIYENFCFAMALLEQRKGDDVGEAKELLIRLLAFQTADGNFPLFLHEFPTCYDSLQRLKIALFLFRALHDFGAVLGSDVRDLLSVSLKRALDFDKELPPQWQFRKDVISGKVTQKKDMLFSNPQDWWEYWISLQFLETPTTSLFHQGLKVYGGSPVKVAQEGFDPAPQLLEWMLCPNKPEHPLMVHLAALKELQAVPFAVDDWQCLSQDDLLLLAAPSDQEPLAAKLLWQGESRIHSLVIATPGSAALQDQGVVTTHRLAHPCPVSRSDLFETNLFVDVDPELDITINGRKGTVFQLGDELIIRSAGRCIQIRCEIAEGSGHFRGHIFRGNRPEQALTQGYEAYDWRIGIRTISRSDECLLRWIVSYTRST